MRHKVLKGIELINCAKANAARGVTYAAKQSGYQENIHLFQQNLYQACEQIGVNIDNLQDLITDQQKIRKNINFQEISPDSLFEL